MTLGNGRARLAIAVVLELLCFAADIRLPQGYGNWVLYFFPLLLVSATSSSMIFIVVSIATILTLAGFALSPVGPFGIGGPVVRFLGLAAFWTFSTVSISRLRYVELLRQREELLRNQVMILDQVQEAIVRVDNENHIRYLNSAAYRLYDIGFDEPVVGSTLGAFFQFEWLSPEQLDDYLQTISSKGVWKGEKIHVTHSGRRIWGESIISEMKDSGGTRSGIVAVIRDTTGRKEAEAALLESRERLRLANEAAGIGTWTLDPEPGVMEWDLTTRRHWGFGPDEPLSPELIFGRLDDENRRKFEEAMKLSQSGQVTSLELDVRHPDGSVHNLLSVARALIGAQGKMVRVVGTSLDITERKIIEQQLRSERQLLQTIFDSIPVMLTVYDSQIRTVQANRELVRVTGWTYQDIAERNLMELTYPDPAYREKMAAYMRSLEPGFRDIRMTCSDGSVRETSWANVGIPDGRQVGIGIDITQRKNAERELRNERNFVTTILDTQGAVVAILDKDFKITRVNRAFEEITNCDTSTIVGSSFWEMMPVDNADEIRRQLSDLMHQKTYYEYDNYISIRQNGTRYIRWRNAVIRDQHGKAEYIVTTGIDITDLIEAQAHVKGLNDKLARKAQELQYANKELEAFSYSVTHDLKAPLRAMTSFARILGEDHAATIQPDMRDLLQRIEESGHKMERLIDDLLNLSRVTRREIRTEELNLSAVADSVVNELRRSDPERTVDVDVQQGCKCTGDPGLMTIVLTNLLGNAWKYTSATENPRIEFGCSMQGNERVFFVSDTGAGFDMKYSDRLFIPFGRLHSEKEFSGTGVGLAIVARIIRRHGGRIWAESKVGQGATFFFTMGNDIL